MRFSIVTVCFNAELCIGEAMRSLASQSFRDFEWLVVDGASTDRTLEVVSSDARLTPRIISEPDKGIYDAMNKGVALARGDYVFFLNADDQFAGPDVLKNVAAALESTGSPQILIGRIWHTFAHHRVLRDYSHLSYSRLLIDSICHQATFAKRELLKASGGFDLQYRLCGDYDWFLRALRSGASYAYCEEIVANFSGDGAHVQRAELTRQEISRIRRHFLGPVRHAAFTVWRYLDHYQRKLRALPPRGHVRTESDK